MLQMEEMETQKLKYSGIVLGVILVTAFVLVQPTLQTARAVGVEGLPAYDDCYLIGITAGGDTTTTTSTSTTTTTTTVTTTTVRGQPEDPISMNTVRNANIVKTVHAEKEIFTCHLEQGDLPVIVDVTTYLEIYENIADREVIETNAIAVTCLKDEHTAIVIDCESNDIPSTPVPVGSNCEELDYITHPQEMNTVNKGKLAKTVESQKEVFLCLLDGEEVCDLVNGCANTIKKVDVILFTETYEDLATHEILDVQFHSARCVVLITDEQEWETDNDLRDATVETCQFSSIEN